MSQSDSGLVDFAGGPRKFLLASFCTFPHKKNFVGKYGRLLGWLYIGDTELSLNEQMITEGYAHAYDGGTKDMNLEKLREIRRAHGTLLE